MKPLVSICLLFGILTNSFNYWLLSTSYAMNKAYISAVLCVNKDRSDIACEGSCFMHINLKELSQKNKNEQKELKQLFEIIAPSSTTISAAFFEVDLGLKFSTYLQQKLSAVVHRIFQPPKLA